jgi:hypothetical protein
MTNPKYKKIRTQLPEIIRVSRQTAIHQTPNRNDKNLNVKMIYKRWPVDVLKMKHSEVKKMEEVSTDPFQPYVLPFNEGLLPPTGCYG